MTTVRYQEKKDVSQEAMQEIIRLNRNWQNAELKAAQEEHKRLCLQEQIERLQRDYARVLVVNRVLACSVKRYYNGNQN